MDNFRERTEYSENEKRLVRAHREYLNIRRKDFDNANTHLWLQKQQNETDLLFVNDVFLEISGKVKPGSKQAEEYSEKFEKVIFALVRIDSFLRVLESTSNSAVAEFIQEKEANERLRNTIRAKDIEIMKLRLEPESLRKEIQSLREQLKFHEESR